MNGQGGFGAPSDPSGPAGLDRLDAMEVRDRLSNVGVFALALVAWALAAVIVTTRDPRLDPGAGIVGAALIGLALGLTAVPLFWLAIFARHRRVAYRGDWLRASRRGAWVAIVAAVFIALRLQGAFQLPIALFVLTMVFIAETTLSVGR